MLGKTASSGVGFKRVPWGSECGQVLGAAAVGRLPKAAQWSTQWPASGSVCGHGRCSRRSMPERWWMWRRWLKATNKAHVDPGDVRILC